MRLDFRCKFLLKIQHIASVHVGRFITGLSAVRNTERAEKKIKTTCDANVFSNMIDMKKARTIYDQLPIGFKLCKSLRRTSLYNV